MRAPIGLQGGVGIEARRGESRRKSEDGGGENGNRGGEAEDSPIWIEREAPPLTRGGEFH